MATGKQANKTESKKVHDALQRGEGTPGYVVDSTFTVYHVETDAERKEREAAQPTLVSDIDPQVVADQLPRRLPDGQTVEAAVADMEAAHAKSKTTKPAAKEST